MQEKKILLRNRSSSLHSDDVIRACIQKAVSFKGEEGSKSLQRSYNQPFHRVSSHGEVLSLGTSTSAIWPTVAAFANSAWGIFSCEGLVFFCFHSSAFGALFMITVMYNLVSNCRFA